MKTLEDKLAEQQRELNWVLTQLQEVRAKLESLENYQQELKMRQLQLEPPKGSISFSPDYLQRAFEEKK